MSSKQSDLPFVAALGFIQGAWTWKRKKTLVPEGPLGRAEFSPKRTLQDVVVTAEVFLVFFSFFFSLKPLLIVQRRRTALLQRTRK